MNTAGDQLLSCAGFAQDQDGGIRRRHSPDLLENGFQSGTVTDDLLKAGLSVIQIAGGNDLQPAHPETSGDAPERMDLRWFRAARTPSSNCASSQGFARNSTAPALSACRRRSSSPCAVIKMMGILCRVALSLDCSSRPEI